MSETKVIKCSCKNEYQDQKYGLFMRVMNWGHKLKVWRCTVCGKSHDTPRIGH